MVPSRRAVLSLLSGTVGGLAGCFDLRQSDPEPTGTPTPSPSRTETPTPPEAADITVEETWAMFQSDAAHTGHAADLGGPGTDPVVDWRSETWGLVTSPVVSDGTIFVATGLRHRHLHAVDAETGAEHWRTEIDGRQENALAVADGVVYAGMDRLTAFDAETGEELWEDMRDVRAGIAVGEGAVFAPSDAVEKLRAFHATTGEQLWEHRAPGNLSPSAVPAVHDGQVYASSHRDLFVVDAENGERRWEQTLPDRSATAPTVTADLVYVPTRSGVHALERSSGDEVWDYGGRFVDASPAVAHGTLYVSGRVEEDDDRVPRLVALDAATGEERWHVERAGFPPGSPVVTDEVVYVTSRDNRLYALDGATGDVHWTLQFEYHLGTPALLDDGLAVSAGGRLYAIGQRTDPAARPWAGVVGPSDGSGSGSGDPPAPAYADHDFYFGTNGYDVVTSAEVRTDPDAPFAFTVDVTGETIDADEQVTVEFTITNESDEELTIESGAPSPFGVVWLEGTDGTDGRLTAWTDAYEETHHVHSTPHRGVTLVNSILLVRPIAPGETISETYTVSTETHGIQPGSYTYDGGFRVRTDDARPGSDDGDEWSPEVTLDLELAQPAPEEGEVVSDLAVSDATDEPSEFIGDLSVDVLEPVRDTHPGLIEITLENVTGELGSVSSPGEWPVGARVGLDADGSRLELMAARTYAPAYVSDPGGDGSWIQSFRPYANRVRRGGRRRFEGDARITRRFLVVGDPDAEDPLTPGSYLFQQGYADDDVEFPWGFRLSVRGREQ